MRKVSPSNLIKTFQVTWNPFRSKCHCSFWLLLYVSGFKNLSFLQIKIHSLNKCLLFVRQPLLDSTNAFKLILFKEPLRKKSNFAKQHLIYKCYFISGGSINWYEVALWDSTSANHHGFHEEILPIVLSINQYAIAIKRNWCSYFRISCSEKFCQISNDRSRQTNPIVPCKTVTEIDKKGIKVSFDCIS